MHGVIEVLKMSLENAAGRSVTVRFANSGGVRARVMAGEAADVAITTAAAIEDLARHGRVLRETVTAVARSAIGVAVRAGAVRPDIGSVDAFTRALLAARSIAMADPATGSPSATHLAGVFERLGLTAALEGKIRHVGGGAGGVVVVGDVVARGEADIGIQQIAEFTAVPGLAVVGEVPAELQKVTVFSAAVTAATTDAAAARRLVAFLASPQAAEVVRASGMQPA
jgi:molybdate transport system substrate-binding protein